ncbi:MAG TPA: NAD(P)H-binding protein [Terriglobales bacterium]|nr:NAD(P)H-binding protein [Terriglobales bacterium]
MILVTGASGNVGGAVLKQLIADKQPVKALYRSKSDAAAAPAGVPVAIADFADRASFAAALEGIDRVLLVCGPIPQLVELETNAIEVCRERRISQIVLNSAMGAGEFNSSFPSWHAKVEEMLKRSGVSYTIIRPNTFLQNIATYYSGTIRQQGAFYGSYGQAPIAYIDVRDIAAVIAAAISGGEHLGKTYELNGPEALTCDQVAAAISKKIGKQVRYVDLPPAEMKKSMLGLGMPEWQVDALLELQRYYREGGDGKTDSLVRNLIGRAPITLDQYLRENLAAFTQPQAASA